MAAKGQKPQGLRPLKFLSGLARILELVGGVFGDDAIDLHHPSAGGGILVLEQRVRFGCANHGVKIITQGIKHVAVQCGVFFVWIIACERGIGLVIKALRWEFQCIENPRTSAAGNY